MVDVVIIKNRFSGRKSRRNIRTAKVEKWRRKEELESHGLSVKVQRGPVRGISAGITAW